MRRGPCQNCHDWDVFEQDPQSPRCGYCGCLPVAHRVAHSVHCARLMIMALIILGLLPPLVVLVTMVSLATPIYGSCSSGDSSYLASVSYAQSYSQRYTVRCGLFGWDRCTRYRKSYLTTYMSETRCCPGFSGPPTCIATLPSTGTSASNSPTESMSSPSSTPSPTEPATLPYTGTSASNPPTESKSSPSSTPSPTDPATLPSTGTSASNSPTESMSSPSSTPSPTEPATLPYTGTSASNPPTESMSTPSSTPSPTEPATLPSTGTSASNSPTESMSTPSSTPSPTEPATLPSTGTSASNSPTETMSSPSSTSLPTEPVTVPSTGTSASNPQTESMSTSSLSSTPSPTESAIVCTVPMDVTNYTTCKGSVLPLTICDFKCNETGNASVLNITCNATGSWSEVLPTCGSLGLSATTMNDTRGTRRKRRETLPLDNQDVLIVQKTFESAILRILTTYFVNATTISAQSLPNSQMQMNLLTGVMYTSDVTVERLIKQIEGALLAVDEFRVVSVDVTDLDALCSPTPCKNNGECRVDYNTFDFSCVCASGYSGPQCSNSSNVVLLAILVPIMILILLFIIFFVVLVVYYRVRLHKLDGYKKRPFHYDMNTRRYEDGMQQLYFTEDRRHQHQDPETFNNSAMGPRFSKEINARMQVRSQQMELHGHHPSASHHDPSDRHRSRTDPIQSGRSLHDRPVTGDQGFQGHRPNGMRSRGNPSLSHETGNGSVVYNEAARRSVNDRNMVFVGRSRNGSMPSDVYVANGFHDTRL